MKRVSASVGNEANHKLSHGDGVGHLVVFRRYATLCGLCPQKRRKMGSTKAETILNSAPGTKAGAKVYGKIVLTLKNQLLPDDRLDPTPSQQDGLDAETEKDLRIYGCELIQTAGILLKLPQVMLNPSRPFGLFAVVSQAIPLALRAPANGIGHFAGCHGYGAGLTAEVLLFQESGARACRSDSDGLCVSCLKD